MKHFFLTFLFLTLLLNAEEQKVNSFLHLGPLNVPVPEKEIDYSNLLEFEHLQKDNWYPSENDFLNLDKSSKLVWHKVNETDLTINNETEKLKIDYFGFYIESNRFTEVNIKMITDGYASLFINNQLKISAKNNNEKLDSVSTKYNLEPNKKFILIKVLTPKGKQTNLSLLTESNYDIKISTENERFTTVEDLLDNPKISDVDISHDGKFAIVKINKRSTDKKSSESYIEFYDVLNKKLISDFSGGMKISSAEWHPKKNIISYEVKGTNGTSIWIYDFESRTNLLFIEEIKDLSNSTWAPNGEFLICSISEKYKDDGSGLKKYTSINDRLPNNKNKNKLYKLDYPSGLFTQIIYDADSPSLNSISNDGSFIIYSVSKVDLTERPYSKTSYYKLNLHNLERDSLFTFSWSGSVKISPNGKNLLITAGASAFGGIGLNLTENLIPNEYDTQAYLYNLETEEVKVLTKDFNPQINNALWADDKTLYFNVTDESYTRLYQYNINSQTFKQIPIPQEDIDRIDFSSDFTKAVYSGSSSTEHTKVYTLNLLNNKTELLADVDMNYNHIKLGTVKDWDFTSSTGKTIKGRVYFPPYFDENKKYPVIVNYYGGTSPTTREFEGRYPKNIWAANGYLVYVLQPSGATGFGQTFSAYHVNDWGTTTADEIIEGTKQFLNEHSFADENNVGCIGASYGGFMTMTLLTKSDIFAAAISHAGISTLTSYWGEGYWGYLYSAIATAESFPWNRKDIYVDKSPIYNADKIKTPLLLLHGSSDTNVPVGESLTMFTALKLLGKDVEFVEVDGQDHWILDYEKRMKWTKTIIAYYDRYLKDQPEWWDNFYPEKLED